MTKSNISIEDLISQIDISQERKKELLLKSKEMNKKEQAEFIETLKEILAVDTEKKEFLNIFNIQA